MRKKKESLKENRTNGFENLINVHTSALEENSEEIAKVLKALTGKELSESNKRDLNFIKKELKRLNNDLDELGDD